MNFTIALLGLVALCFTSGRAFANVGVPPLFNTAIEIVLFLIPIVIIETIALKNQLAISARSIWWAVAIANLVSTFAGVLITFIEDYVHLPFLPMRVGAGAATIDDLTILALLLPFFILSIAIEVPLLRLLKIGLDRRALRRAAILANICSYLLIAAFLVGRIIKGAIVHGKLIVQFPPY